MVNKCVYTVRGLVYVQIMLASDGICAKVYRRVFGNNAYTIELAVPTVR